MASDRWDGNVHVYRYTAETARRVTGRDALMVAEAFIHGADADAQPVGLILLVSAQDLRGKTTLAGAIDTAERTLPRLVEKHRTDAGGQTFIYTYAGRLVGSGS